MRVCCLTLVGVLLVCVWAAPALALHEFEVWRSPGGDSNGIMALNATDGSVWARFGDTVYHYGSDGTLLGKSELWDPRSVSVNPEDGSCWVVDWAPQDPMPGPNDPHYALLRLDVNGNEVGRLAQTAFFDILPSAAGPDGSVWVAHYGGPLWRVSADYGIVAQVPLSTRSLSTDPADGTCWAVDAVQNQLVHVGLDGSELWRGGAFQAYSTLAVWGADGSVWAWDRTTDDLVRVSTAGVELARVNVAGGVRSVTVDQADGSCWASPRSGSTAHVGADGTILGQVAGAGYLYDVSTNTFWDNDWGAPLHIAADGAVLWRGQGEVLQRLYLDPSDGSVWTWRGGFTALLHLSAEGEELLRIHDLEPASGALNPADGSLYLLYANEGRLLRVSRDGAQEWSDMSYLPDPNTTVRAYALAVDPRDGSFWVSLLRIWDAAANRYQSAILRLAVDGTELTRLPLLEAWPGEDALVVSPKDGSWWVSLHAPVDRLARYRADGSELWHWDSSDGSLTSVSVDFTDNSCWVSSDTAIHHLDQDGVPVGQIAEPAAYVACDPERGRLWVGLSACVVAYEAGSGQRLWLGQGFRVIRALAVRAADGSVWVDSLAQGQLVHLWVPITPFPDVPPEFWAARSILACYQYGIVGGYPDGYYRPEWPVSRAAMAGFIARALAEGDANVPPGPETPHFPDVPADYWAYKYVEYAYANNIVAGYPGGSYAPEVPVDRGQMAAFVARAIVTPTGEEGLAGYTPPATPTFPDVPTDFWTYKHIEYIREAGIVGGYPDGLYHPENWCTRDQMAVFVARAFDLLPY